MEIEQAWTVYYPFRERLIEVKYNNEKQFNKDMDDWLSNMVTDTRKLSIDELNNKDKLKIEWFNERDINYIKRI